MAQFVNQCGTLGYILNICLNSAKKTRLEQMPWQSPRLQKIQILFGETSKSYKKVIPNASSVNGANNPSSISAIWKHILNMC